MSLYQLFKSASLISPELILTLSGLVLTAIAPVMKKTPGKRGSRILCAVALAGFACAFALNAGRFGNPQTAFSGSLSLDAFAAYFNSIFLASAAAATFFVSGYFRETGKLGELLALLTFCATGMMLMAESVEFVSLFIAFETMSVCVYALSGFSRNMISSAEAGIKYLVAGGFASAVMLFGIALLYGAAGGLSFEEVGARFSQSPSNPMMITGAALVLAGLIFKIGAAPMHQWVPDVYHGAPAPVTAFMSVGVKIAAFAILARFAVEVGAAGIRSLETILTAVAIVTMTVGNVSAIVQSNVKRMLAYSSIAHSGYAIVAIAAYLSGNESGISGLFYYLGAYAIMNLGAFGIVSLLGKDGNEYQSFSDISGLWRTRPALAVALAVFMFSLAGVPPTAGFFAKYRAFLPAAEAGMYWLVLFALVNSVVSAYYYLKVLVFVFMRPVAKQRGADARESGLGAGAAVALLCAGTLLAGIFPMRWVEMADAAARALMFR